MFRNKLYNLIVFAAVTFTALYAIVGCQRDATVLDGIPSDVISFEIGGNDLTKSGVTPEYSTDKSCELVSGKDIVYMRRYVRDLSDEELYAESSTKGAAVTRENVETFYGDKLLIAAFTNKGTGYIVPQAISYVSRDVETKISTWKTKEPYSWPSYELHFWGWAPNGSNDGYINPKTLTYNTLSFDFTSPKGSNDYANRDAEVQKDIIVSNTITDASSCKGKVHLLFKHVLSAIKFEVGKTDECTINSVSITAKSKGTCTYQPSESGLIQWSNLLESKTFTQTFDADISEHLTDDDTVQQIDQSVDKSKTFMLIPQTAGDDNTISLEVKLTIKDSGEQITFTKELDKNLTDWEAGKVYTYVLSVSNGLEISVTDTVLNNTKSGLKISNTYSSTVKCYIRAAITGNWYDVKGKIVDAWKVENESFVGLPTTVGETADNNWTRGADGFYYYKYPVYPGKLTGQTATDADGDPLFVSYTAPAATISGSELNIQIAAQGIQWDASKNFVKEAWGDTAAQYLSIDDKGSN